MTKRQLPSKNKTSREDDRNIAIALVAIVFSMTVLAFAAVPLYKLFCEATGLGGTTQIGIEAPKTTLERRIKVRFNADLSPELPWSFRPLQRELTVRVGETALAFFEVENFSDRPMSGWATYNVTPHKAGPYFAKMQCFCFSEQVIPARQKLSLPVSFFIDPKIMDDKSLNNVDVITLSYSFFQFKGD